jgi:mono/diheme cytochrome c family protein
MKQHIGFFTSAIATVVAAVSFVVIPLYSGAASGASELPVPAGVKAINDAKCVRCHQSAPAGHAAAFPQSAVQCGGCHVPFKRDHAQSNCIACHASPAVTHFNLRDYNAKDTPAQHAVTQARFGPKAEEKCIACHVKGAKSLQGKGFPALVTEAQIVAAARLGTLRQWVQPGGFMAKYLTPAEASTLTKWVDSISIGRRLDYDPYLDAARIDQDFEITGAGDHPSWRTASQHVVNLVPTIYTPVNEVKLSALYSGEYLYIRAEHKDKTLSMTRSDAWEWTGSAWKAPYFDPKNVDNTKQSEDRIAFTWNMSIPDYKAVYGCAVKCHGNIPGSSEFTDVKGQKADSWHSKAARGVGALRVTQIGPATVNPVTHEATAGHFQLEGWLDDKFWTSYQAYEDGYDTEDAGRRPDKGRGVDARNRNAARNGPLVMKAAPANFIDAMGITQKDIDEGRTIVADPADPKFDKAKVDEAWAIYAKFNAAVPERILRTPDGSRADVRHSAVWKDGTWIHEFKRKLNTGHPEDDVVFDLAKAREYEFSISVFNNSGRGEIPPGHTTYGDGQYQVLRFK